MKNPKLLFRTAIQHKHILLCSLILFFAPFYSVVNFSSVLNTQTLTSNSTSQSVEIELISEFPEEGFASKIVVHDNLAYLADYQGGLEIFNVSDPFSPDLIGHFHDGGLTRSVFVSGSYAYLADSDDGLEIIDISDPTNPVEVGQYGNSTSANDVFVNESYAYVTSYNMVGIKSLLQQ